ncbi:predicted protein [Nematostella vectensis]|uniref:PiggyBac transposable element-derived protein domain-containing protein n=1 Tax=Nematostella vectensis TaxID=45351 RepID=A7STK1_NEMVE|nr:predicted protein [Nematostella vectensis]|eukprot:XP_001625058.1 predicted protein [Nematostella vectensis]
MKKCEISINQPEIEQKTQQTLVLPALHITDKSKDEEVNMHSAEISMTEMYVVKPRYKIVQELIGEEFTIFKVIIPKIEEVLYFKEEVNKNNFSSSATCTRFAQLGISDPEKGHISKNKDQRINSGTEELIEHIFLETNRYARQCQQMKPDEKWYEAIIAEMHAFLGLNILFGFKELPETRLYWSSEPVLGVAEVKKLAEDLLKDKIYLSGTTSNRKDFPAKLKGAAVIKNLRRGESIFHQKGNVVCTIWKDKKAVAFISTQCEAKGTETVNRRQKDGSIVKVDFLPVVTIYNKFIGGVDKADQYWQYYEVFLIKKYVVEL